MSFSVIFNEFELNSYLSVTDLRRGIGTSVTNNLKKSQLVNGSKFINQTKESWTIEMDFILVHDLVEKRRKLADIFNVDGPTKLIFGDEPEIYYLATPDGKIDFSEINFLGKGTITFLVPEGISHGIDEKTFTKNSATSAITINNEGTYKTNAVFEIDFTEDTDYVALITGNDIIQLGTVDDVDETQPKLQENLFVDEMGGTSKSKWSENVARIRWRGDTSLNTGNVQWRDSDVWAANYGTSDDQWHGPSLVRYLNDSAIENWEATFRVGFRKSSTQPKIQQVGQLEGNVLDADNNFIAGFELKKESTSNENITYHFFIGDNSVFRGTVPYKYREFFGNVVIKKVGNKIVFSISGISDVGWTNTWSYSRSYTNDDVANLRANSMAMWFGVWGKRLTMYQRCSYTKFDKLNTSELSEVPLTFSAGDHLEITENLKVFLNGTPADDYLANGSEKMYLETGETEILVASDKSPTVIAKIRPKYL